MDKVVHQLEISACPVILSASFTHAGLSAAAIHHEGSKFSDIFPLKNGSFADLPAARISEMMKLNSLEVVDVTFPLSGKSGTYSLVYFIYNFLDYIGCVLL